MKNRRRGGQQKKLSVCTYRPIIRLGSSSLFAALICGGYTELSDKLYSGDGGIFTLVFGVLRMYKVILLATLEGFSEKSTKSFEVECECHTTKFEEGRNDFALIELSI